jgi:hypothetical protein
VLSDAVSTGELDDFPEEYDQLFKLAEADDQHSPE